MNEFCNDWDLILKEEFKKEYYQKLIEFLKKEYEQKTIYPCRNDIFNAFKYTSYENIKVVIIGQDPYHKPGQAHGLSFSVKIGMKKPPSLVNIFKELKNDMNIESPTHGTLERWAKQGVFLLNSCLTVESGKANSHRNKGWEIFTDYVIEKISEKNEPVVFILWGNKAKEKEKLIINKNHLIIKGAHPSPLSVHNGFFEGKYFSRAQSFLAEQGIDIDWSL